MLHNSFYSFFNKLHGTFTHVFDNCSSLFIGDDIAEAEYKIIIRNSITDTIIITLKNF